MRQETRKGTENLDTAQSRKKMPQLKYKISCGKKKPFVKSLNGVVARSTVNILGFLRLTVNFFGVFTTNGYFFSIRVKKELLKINCYRFLYKKHSYFIAKILDFKC